eukprot:15484400-Alexandrium_andersonii.AAC.1
MDTGAEPRPEGDAGGATTRSIETGQDPPPPAGQGAALHDEGRLLRHPELHLATMQEATARPLPAPVVISVRPSCRSELEAGCPCLNTQCDAGQRSTPG